MNEKGAGSSDPAPFGTHRPVAGCPSSGQRRSSPAIPRTAPSWDDASRGIYIGKADITDGLVKQAEEALEARELIKCAVQDGSDLSAREAADALAERTCSEVVQIIGHRFALYRASSRKDIEHIELG